MMIAAFRTVAAVGLGLLAGTLASEGACHDAGLVTFPAGGVSQSGMFFVSFDYVPCGVTPLTPGDWRIEYTGSVITVFNNEANALRGRFVRSCLFIPKDSPVLNRTYSFLYARVPLEEPLALGDEVLLRLVLVNPDCVGDSCKLEYLPVAEWTLPVVEPERRPRISPGFWNRYPSPVGAPRTAFVLRGDADYLSVVWLGGADSGGSRWLSGGTTDPNSLVEVELWDAEEGGCSSCDSSEVSLTPGDTFVLGVRSPNDVLVGIPGRTLAERVQSWATGAGHHVAWAGVAGVELDGGVFVGDLSGEWVIADPSVPHRVVRLSDPIPRTTALPAEWRISVEYLLETNVGSGSVECGAGYCVFSLDSENRPFARIPLHGVGVDVLVACADPDPSDPSCGLSADSVFAVRIPPN